MAQRQRSTYNNVFYDRLVDLYINKRLDYFFKERKIKKCATCGHEFTVKLRRPRGECMNCENSKARNREFIKKQAKLKIA